MATVSGEQLWFLDDDQAIPRWWLWLCRLTAAAILYFLVFGSLMILMTPVGDLVADGIWMAVGVVLAYIVYDFGTELGARWAAR